MTLRGVGGSRTQSRAAGSRRAGSARWRRCSPRASLLSRVLGFVREVVLACAARRVGARSDAYRAAFLLPDLLNHFLAGGALSIAFIPLYTRARARERAREARARCSRSCSARTTLAGRAGDASRSGSSPEPLVALQFPGSRRREAARSRCGSRASCCPAQIFFIAGGVLRGALMAHGRFVGAGAGAARLQPRHHRGRPRCSARGSAPRASPGARWSGAALGRLRRAAGSRRARAGVRLGLRVAPRDPRSAPLPARRAAAHARRHAAHGRRVVRRVVRRAARRPGAIAALALRAPAAAAAGRRRRSGDRRPRRCPSLAQLCVRRARRGARRACCCDTLRAGLALGVPGRRGDAARSPSRSWRLLYERGALRRRRPARVARLLRDLRVRGAGVGRAADRGARLLRARRHVAADAARHRGRGRGRRRSTPCSARASARRASRGAGVLGDERERARDARARAPAARRAALARARGAARCARAASRPRRARRRAGARARARRASRARCSTSRSAGAVFAAVALAGRAPSAIAALRGARCAPRAERCCRRCAQLTVGRRRAGSSGSTAAAPSPT